VEDIAAIIRQFDIINILLEVHSSIWIISSGHNSATLVGIFLVDHDLRLWW
jgi:hypothetical protein